MLFVISECNCSLWLSYMWITFPGLGRPMRCLSQKLCDNHRPYTSTREDRKPNIAWRSKHLWYSGPVALFFCWHLHLRPRHRPWSCSCLHAIFINCDAARSPEVFSRASWSVLGWARVAACTRVTEIDCWSNEPAVADRLTAMKTQAASGSVLNQARLNVCSSCVDMQTWTGQNLLIFLPRISIRAVWNTAWGQQLLQRETWRSGKSNITHVIFLVLLVSNLEHIINKWHKCVKDRRWGKSDRVICQPSAIILSYINTQREIFQAIYHSMYYLCGWLFK